MKITVYSIKVDFNVPLMPLDRGHIGVTPSDHLVVSEEFDADKVYVKIGDGKELSEAYVTKAFIEANSILFEKVKEIDTDDIKKVINSNKYAILDEDLQQKLKDIAAKEGFDGEVVFIDSEDHELCEANGVDAYLERSACGWGIEIGLYKDPDIAVAAFFHELGHVSNRLKGQSHSISTVIAESTAWSIGFKIAHENGYEYDYQSKEYEYARKSVASYVNGEYDDMKEFYTDDN